MINKYISYISLFLILTILIQIEYFSKSLNIGAISMQSKEELSFKTNNIVGKKVILSTNWVFSNGESSIIVLKDELKKNIDIVVKKDKLKKEMLILPKTIDTIPVYQNLSNSNYSNHNISYIGVANSEGELSFFFEIDNNYVYLKINDIYNNIKLISVGSSNITLIDLVNNKEYSVSK